jgi:quinol-cytochrome oxidoreductase complex cytochrome b subunit
MFYIFVVDFLVLSVVGAQPPEGHWIITGQVATFVYFATFLTLPFLSRAEERWLMQRGLPEDVMNLVKAEKQRSQFTGSP